MNFSKLAENISLEEDEFLELVELFVKTSASDLERLQSAIDGGRTQQAVEAAHSVKGAAGNLGFTGIYDLAKAIEEKARQNSLEGASEALKAIRDRHDRIAEALRTD
jgi:HPt (histidine-containing phosphotransfer) domain-containing protein